MRKGGEDGPAFVYAALATITDELGVDRDAVTVEVLSEGKGGILGVGSSDARVRVALVNAKPAAPGVEAAEAGAEGEGEGEFIEDEAESPPRCSTSYSS